MLTPYHREKEMGDEIDRLRASLMDTAASLAG